MMLIDNLRVWLILMFIGHIEGQRLVFFSNQTTYSTGSQPSGVAAGDVNGDNQTDIIVSSYGSNKVGILFNRGNGTFINQKTYATGSSPQFVAAADLNGDKKLDLITPNSGDNTISVLMNKGNGTYANQITYATDDSPSCVSIADVNGDSYFDIIVSHIVDTKVAVLLNLGNGTFKSPKSYSTGSTSWLVTAGDLNNDNRPDIVVANYDSNNVGVFLNMGNGTFMTQRTYSTGSQPYSVALGDVNGDNKTDIVVVNYASSTASILLNTGNGTFQSHITYRTTSKPKAVAVADVNADNWPDIIVANDISYNIDIFLNRGNGTFINQTTYSTGANPVSVLVVDVNDDQKLDIIVTNEDSNTIGVFLCLGYKNGMTTLSQRVTTVETKTERDTSIVMSTEETSTSQPSNCSSLKLTLIPSAILSNPISFRRNEDLSIVSIIKYNCNNSLAIVTEWNIINCTGSCSNSVEFDATIVRTSNDLFIPSGRLFYGIYQIELRVTVTNSSWLKTSQSVYIEIIPSNIVVNAFVLGTSMLTIGNEQDLVLNPGSYSIDPDNDIFNANDWTYEYSCRIYDISTFLPIENCSCLSNQTEWKYSNSIGSSLTIFEKSLKSNQICQFMIEIKNRKDSSRNGTGYTLVQIENIGSSSITMGCAIWTLCLPTMDYYRLNPTTQLSLFSNCNANCSKIENVKWNIYYESNNSVWKISNQSNFYENIWIFGINTNNLTVTNQLFLTNLSIQFWKFEVIYSFVNGINISSSLNFLLNQQPRNGSCSISPQNGTTTTLFTISCSNWFDEDGIEDYSLYSWTIDPNEKIFLGYWSFSQYQLRLPAGDDQTSLLNLSVYIRDQFDCVTQFNLTPIYVQPDLITINDFITNYQDSSNKIQQILTFGNSITINQIITSLSQQLNKINDENIERAVSNGTSPTSIFISSLDDNNQQLFLATSQLTFSQYKQQLNSYAHLREYLISLTTQFPISTFNSIQLQSSTLVQLTKATNQLTRLAITTVANKCYQLTMALDSMALTLSYEDIQSTVTSLIQCATNVLTAVNGPLQERTPVLDLDSSRGTAFPTDYDTDLESDWSKLNLIVNGNIYYQKQLANQINDRVNEIIAQLTSILMIHLNLKQNFTINQSEVFMSLETESINSLTNKQIRLQTNLLNNEKILIQSMIQPLAVLGNSQSSANTNLSRSISLSIIDQNGNEVSVQANETNPIEIIIPRDPNFIVSSMILQNVTSINSTPHQQLFHLHYVNLTSSFPISVHIEISPLNISLAYLFIYKFDQIPQLNSSVKQIDGWTILCPSNLSNDSIYTYFLNNQLTQNHQSLVFGLRELNLSDCSNLTLTNPPITDQRYNFTSNYQLRVYSSGCYYLDENNQWNGQGLRVGPLTNHQQTQCFSTHLTTFAGGFLILPEPINWQFVFANADFMKNKTIYLTVIGVTAIYLLVMIYARYKDKKDLEKLGIIPLSDNHQSDRYFYQILVFTGHRKESGTKSEVQFVLGGDQDQTQIRTFANSKREIFQQGGIDGFVMSVPQYLGPLNYLHIWHDNSGKGSSASWFLKYLIVRDLQTMEISYFIAQRWFAVDKDDGRIERLLPVASEIEKNEVTYLIMKKAYNNISDDHLWFSIFSRPPSNRFSRVQRCTCCFVLFFLSMFLNIMYYDLSNQSKTNNSTNSLRLGPLILSREQIGIGITVDLLALIPSLLLVQIFRRLQLRKQPKKNTKFTFPWWFKFVGYGLCLILVGVSMFFIIARGIEFGDLKTQQWLTSILTGFFSSILLTQPIKILCLAIFFTRIYRKSDDDEKHAKEYFTELDENEEFFPKKSYSLYHRTTRSNRLTENEIVYARNERMKEVQMWSLLHEICIYLTFLCLLFLLTYSHRTTNPYLQVQHVQNYFDFDDISTVDDYWNWLEESFVENLRAQQWYNGDQARNLSGYMNDKTNRLIGWATMRQLRVKSDLCPYRKWNHTCQEDFSLFNEEKNSFELGWTNVTLNKSNKTNEQAFEYQSTDELDSYTIIGYHGIYPGDGYVYEFRGHLSDIQTNLSMLRQFQWIDSQTRAVIIQLNLYNPNVQLFTSVMFLTEFLSTGGLQTTIQIEPIDFYVSLTSTCQLIFLIIYMIFILYFLFIEIQSLFRLKQKYFQQFWPVIEFGIIVCSWMSVVLYISRYKEYSRISQLFAETNGYVYVNLQYFTYLNNFLTYMYGFCCFFGTMKMIRLFRFNSRVYLFISTLEISAKELVGFALMFSIVFFAYMSLFYLLFSSKLWSASSLLQTAEMLFEMSVKKYHAHPLSDADAFLGPFAFSLFIFVVVFVCLSMFITIIIQNFRQAKENQKKNDEIYSFIWKRFLRWTGLMAKQEIPEEYDATMRTQYVEPFAVLHKRVDKLLETLNRIYMDQHA